MSGLATLQHALQRRILAHEAGIEGHLVEPATGDFDARIQTYVGGYRVRLVEALGTTYEVLQKTLGEERFEELMLAYIEKHRSTHYSIRYYGADVFTVFADEADLDARATLADLARWEWLLAEVFDAPDDEPLAPEALAQVPAEHWGAVSFRPRASLRRIETLSNAVEFWRAAQGLSAAPAHFSAGPPVQWVLWRRGISTFFRSLEPLECAALDAALAGESFAQICERLAALVGEIEVALRAASLLRSWLAEELLAGLIVPGTAP